MNLAITVVVSIVVLFVLAFFTKRRFGVLGLALTAGAMLSTMWADQLTPYIEKAGVQIVAPPLQSVVAAAVILLPAVVLLFSGPTYTKLPQKVIGAAAFALLAAAFLLTPIGGALVLSGDSQKVYELLAQNRVYIITAGIIFAIVDLLMVRSPKPSKEK